jgi:hypothetical protein
MAEAEDRELRAAEGDADVMVELAEDAASVGDLKAAREWYERALDLDGYGAAAGLGALLVQVGDLQALEALAKKVAASGDADALVEIGLAARDAGAADAARSVFGLAVEAGSADAVNVLGQLLADAGNLEALQALGASAIEHGFDGDEALSVPGVSEALRDAASARAWYEGIADAHRDAALAVMHTRAMELEDRELMLFVAREAAVRGGLVDGIDDLFDHASGVGDAELKGWCELTYFDGGSIADASEEAREATAAVLIWLASDDSRRARERGIISALKEEGGFSDWESFVKSVEESGVDLSESPSLVDPRLVTSVLDNWLEFAIETNPYMG